MKTILLLLLFVAAIWSPVIFKLYNWKEGIILTISLSIASYLIDRLILNRSKEEKGSHDGLA